MEPGVSYSSLATIFKSPKTMIQIARITFDSLHPDDRRDEILALRDGRTKVLCTDRRRHEGGRRRPWLGSFAFGVTGIFKGRRSLDIFKNTLPKL